MNNKNYFDWVEVLAFSVDDKGFWKAHENCQTMNLKVNEILDDLKKYKAKYGKVKYVSNMLDNLINKLETLNIEG